jgi:hypothetical protein
MRQPVGEWYDWEAVQRVVSSKYPTGDIIEDTEKIHAGKKGDCIFFTLKIPPTKKIKASFVVYIFNDKKVILDNNLFAQLYHLDMTLDDFRRDIPIDPNVT